MTKSEAYEMAFRETFVPVSRFDYGDTYLIDQFIDYVADTSIMDYDGIGYLVYNIEDELYEYKGATIWCDVDWLLNQKKAGITHIRWYNK